MATSSKPIYFRARSVYGHQQQAGLLSAARHPCTCPPAAGLSTLGHEATVYMPQSLAAKSLRLILNVARRQVQSDIQNGSKFIEIFNIFSLYD